MSLSTSSIYATPSRHDRLPQSSSSPSYNTHRQPAPASSTSNSALSSSSHNSLNLSTPANKDRPLTSASLLKSNSNAEDPKLAALEQAVNDRNSLSSQNSQLWKLIEKQRAGYNHILKELDRVRNERDAYKTRLAGSSNHSRDDKRQTGIDPDKHPKRSVSGQASSLNEHVDPLAVDRRHAMSRYHSDEQPTLRSLSHPSLHSSRSHEPLAPRDTLSLADTSTPNSLIPPSQVGPPPLSAPSLPSTQFTSLAMISQPPGQPTLIAGSIANETLSLFSASAPSADRTARVNSIASPQPAAYPRKSSLTDTSNTSNSLIVPISAGASLSPSPIPSVTSPYQYSTGIPTPHTAPAGFGNSNSETLHVHSVTQDTETQFSLSMVPPSMASSNPMLSAPVEGRPNMLSRDSRISLPDEARRYIANMTDSPIPSPHVDSFGTNGSSRITQHEVLTPSQATGPTAQPPLSSVEGSSEKSEFLDMNEDEDDEDSDDSDGDETDDEQSALPEDASDSISLLDTADRLSQTVPQSGEAPPEMYHNTFKPQVAADYFPLPPTNTSTPQLGSVSSYPTSEEISPLENPYSPPGQGQQQSPQPLQPLRLDRSQPQRPMVQSVPAQFRALPLLPTDLPHTTITVTHSFVRPNDRGKEVLSFIVFVDPGNRKGGWKVEKMYSDVLGLDQRVRNAVGKGIGKRIASLPEGKLWKDHAPAKVDQRKAVLESYLQTLVRLPVKENNEVIAFFTSDIVRETKQPVLQVGHKEGYLTKRGKNFGGWKTRYFVLQGPILEYYDCRGGTHLGSIHITGAQIGRQQRSERAPTTDEEKEYRHAFLIVEARKGPGGNHPRHVLCAESDDDRDAWVEILVRYFTGTYSEEPVKYGPVPVMGNTNGAVNTSQPRTSTSSNSESPVTSRRPSRGLSKDDISISKGPAVLISQLPPDQINAKLLIPTPLVVDDLARSSSPSKHVESPIDPSNNTARRILERSHGMPSSLPDSSPLSSVSNFQAELAGVNQRANSELGHYTDLNSRSNRQSSPERHRTRDPHDKHKSFHPTLNPVGSSPTVASPVDRVPSPEKTEANKVKISGPLNGAPIPSGFKFGGKDAPPASEPNTTDRRIKSRSFWGFGKPNGDKTQPLATFSPRAVFGVTLEDSLDVAQIANLPAIVFRCIQYLEAKKADQEEGIYRLSGSSAVIKNLKDRFNSEADVDLLGSDEYWDPHAIAGLLKSFLRELPASILTRDLHLRFLAVIDFVDAQERITELSRLIAALPVANYSLLRALTAHLILIVQNSAVNKMTMRNVGIVFSPTLGIPAGVFSLMLGEFNRVFNVDAEEETTSSSGNEGADLDRRNSKHYSDAAADQLLGLTGRSLKATAQETPSDGDDLSVQDESGAESIDGEPLLDTSSESGKGSEALQTPSAIRITPPDTPIALQTKFSKASNAAATRGLNVTINGPERGNRQSRMIGLPASPRPTQTATPSRPLDVPGSPHPRRD